MKTRDILLILGAYMVWKYWKARQQQEAAAKDGIIRYWVTVIGRAKKVKIMPDEHQEGAPGNPASNVTAPSGGGGSEFCINLR